MLPAHSLTLNMTRICNYLLKGIENNCLRHLTVLTLCYYHFNPCVGCKSEWVCCLVVLFHKSHRLSKKMYKLLEHGGKTQMNPELDYKI